MLARKAAVIHWARRWRSLRVWGRPLVEVEIAVRARREEFGQHSTGRAQPQQRTVVVTAGSDMADALATALHELAHVAAPGDALHGERWQGLFAGAVLEVTGLSVACPVHNYRHLDREATEAVRSWWKQSGNEFAWRLLAEREGER